MPNKRKTSNMIDSVGSQSLSKKPTMLLKSYPMAPLSENIGNKRTPKINITYNIINKTNLAKLTKNQLIALLLEKQSPTPASR